MPTPLTDDEAAQAQKHLNGLSGAPSGDGGSVLGSLGAGAVGAAKEAAGSLGLGGDWAKSEDKDHSTAEWVGRETADWAPLLAFDATAPEVALPAAASRYAPRLASLAGKALTGAYKGAFGGLQSQDSSRGAETGAATGAVGGAARAGFQMLPGWAKAGVMAGIPNLAGLASLAHEMGAGGRYISPWAVHHALSALGGLAGAAAGVPATAGAGVSAVQNALDPETQGQ